MKNDCLLSQEVPLVLFVASEPGLVEAGRKALESKGWEVRIAENGTQARAIATAEQPTLVVLDFDDWLSDAESTAQSIRTLPGAAAAAPILGFKASAGTENDPESIRVDGIISPPRTAEDLVQALLQWWPVSLEPTRRIAAMFGPGPIAGMIERLARRLEAALAVLDRGGFDKAEAHRLAGLCGTLGFAQAHAAWLDVSLGDESALDEVRRTTRLTLAAIARGL